MTRILLVRHGETDWNRDERWQGHAGPSLNERGRAQAAAVALRLAGRRPVVLVTSDLRAPGVASATTDDGFRRAPYSAVAA